MNLNNMNDLADAENMLNMYKADVKGILDSYKNIAGLKMGNENIITIRDRILADIGELYKVYNKSYFSE